MKKLSNIKRWLLVVGLLGLGSSSALSQPVSPVGTWDLLISGSERGIAYITFADDFSLSGYEVLSPTKKGDPDTESRGGTDEGRTVITTTPGSTPGTTTTVTNLVGAWGIVGTWWFDSKGRVAGFYSEGAQNASCTTNQQITSVVSNNIIDGLEISVTNFFTNDVILCVTNPITNGVSFSAIARTTRLTIKTKGNNGSTTLKGIPAFEAPDVSGTYSVQGQKEGAPDFNEIMTITTVGNNAFVFTGQGGGYDTSGVGLVSNQKQLAVTYISTTNSPVISASGPFNFDRATAKLTRTDANGVRGRFRLTRLSVP
jgi:hypothetical protein